METRKLSLPTDQRNPMLRGLVTDLLWHGKIETTLAQAKAVSRLADKYITIAINSYSDVITEEKVATNEKGKEEKSTLVKDGPKKLAARRTLMAKLYDKKEEKGLKETKSAYKARTAQIQHPLIERLFDDLAPKQAKRAEELGTKGGYTRVLKTKVRRGDNAQLAIVTLV